MGTLTGAARVALGPDLPPFYTNDETLARTSRATPRRRTIRCGDCRCGRLTIPGSIPRSPTSTTRRRARFAGSITCALFLQRFVEDAKSWLHVDIYGWTPSAKPARPEGGECQAARAIYKLLGERYG